MKKLLIIFGLAFVLTCFPVMAVQQSYETTLSMGANTYLTSATRQYNYGNFRIIGNVTEKDSNLSKQKLYIAVYAVKWLGSSMVIDGVADYANRPVFAYDFGRNAGGKGKKYLKFKTRSKNDNEAYGAIYSNRTYLISYE